MYAIRFQLQSNIGSPSADQRRGGRVPVQSNLQEYNEAFLPVRIIVCEYLMLRQHKRTWSALMKQWARGSNQG